MTTAILTDKTLNAAIKKLAAKCNTQEKARAYLKSIGAVVKNGKTVKVIPK